jgi:pimeloyl-ACP methyl ester carboxylesterase
VCHDHGVSDTTDATPSEPLIVLVHGAWHGAWCWATLQAELDRRGLASLAVDLPGHGASLDPLTDLHGDAAHLARVVDHVAPPSGVVLVGHSYGGAVITHAASLSATPAAHLVYIAAFALNDGESVMSLIMGNPGTPITLGAAMIQRPDGTSVLDPVGAAASLYGRCSQSAIDAALPRLSPQPGSTMVQPVVGSPRSSIPSTYVVCTEDLAVSLGHQRLMAARCSRTVEFDTDHSPFVSLPGPTADVLERVVRG